MLLATGAILPIVLCAIGIVIFTFWQQRDTMSANDLERVRAMAITLDTELDASIRLLRAISSAPELDVAHPQQYADRMKRYIAVHPMWDTLAMGDPGWNHVAVVGTGDTKSWRPEIEPRTLMRLTQNHTPAVSPLLRTADNRFETQIAVPIIREGALAGVIMANVDQKAWLQLLQQYRMPSGSTVTLIDQDGIIIARTLNNETWVGKPPAPSLGDRLRYSNESAFRSTGLEGQRFYTAFSHSPHSGWAVATGVPAEEFDAPLWATSFMLAGGVLVSLGVAVLLAVSSGRLIETAIGAGSGGGKPPGAH